MAVLSFEEYKKQVQEGKKPESLYVSNRAMDREAGAENVPAETASVADPQKSGVKTWTHGGSTYVTDRSTGKTTQTFSALDYFIGGGKSGDDIRRGQKLVDMAKAKETGKEIKHESLFLDLDQMNRGTVENIGAAYSSAVATLANTAGAIVAGDNNYEPEEDSFIWKLVESAEGKTGYAESNLENAKEGRGAVGRFAMDIGSAGLELAVDQALNFIVPGSGMAAMGVRSFGRKSEASREAGESVSTQVIKGSIAAATAVATERMSEIGGLKTGKPGYLDRAWDKVTNVMESKTGSKILGRVVTGFGSEALEEVIESVINPIAQRAFGAFGLLGDDEADAFESIGQIAYEGLVGGTLGALGAVGNVEYNGAQESGENAAPNITAEELARSCENATNLAIDQHLGKAEAQANEQAALAGMETQAAGTTVADGTPQPATPTATIAEETFREAQTQAAEMAKNAQRATTQAETPPAAQNAAQTASGELNTQAEMEAREEGTGVQRDAMPTEGADTVRGFSENVATDSAMETALREDIAKNPDLYKRLSNKDTLKKAQDIFSQGIDTARSELERAIGAAQSGQKLAPEMVPLSRMVANELTRRGELDAARKIISDVAAELTSAGQLGQAGAILRNADPMTVLNTLQKAIDQINAEMAKKFGKRNPWTAELTAEEIKQISETDFSQDGAFEAVQQQIAERLGREMPATLMEKLREIRKVGMLANPKTQLKNVFGNAPLAGERKIAERLSGGLQELAVKAGIMSKDEQTRTLRVSQESKGLAKSVYDNNIDRITRQGNKGELRGILKDTRTYFNKGLLQKGIEKATGHQLNDAALDYVRRFTYDCLEKGDAPFVKSAFIDSLAQYCEAQGIKAEADVTETAISYAIDQAMAATFKDASAFAKLLNSIKDNAGIAGQALDVLLPFTTTPINIAKEFGKYSPLGYLQLLNAKGKGTAEVIDIISRATTGSAVVAIGAILRSLGFITGAADDDKDKAAADKAAGISPYSILGKYSYEWAQPTGSALAMGAEIYDSAKDGGSLIETISNGIISAGDAYLEQSFYKDIIDLFQGYGSPTENVIRELLTGTASQFIPTIAGATARTIDPTVRTSYSGGNIIDDILAQAKVKTPGISKSAPASVNVRGEEIQRGNLVQRILDNFIFPWTTNRNGGDKNAVDQAIDEVYEETGDKTIFRQVSPYKVDYGGETYKMTGEEREQFQKTQGQVHDDIIQQIIDGTLWEEMDSDAKVKTMQLANEYALDAAKRELVESRGDEYSSNWDDEAQLPDVGNYLAAKTTLKAAQDSKDYTLLDALVDTVTEQQKAVQEKLNKDFSMLDELIYGKQHGVDAETIYTAKTEADANGNGKISQEELWYYLGIQKNMPTETKDVLWDILTTGKTGYAEYAEKHK